MAQGEYRVNEIIRLTYQAANLLSAAAPTCKVFDEAGASDLVAQSALHSALTAGEKAQGRYHGHFTPDAEGRWTVYILDKNSAGAVTKTYNVGGHNVDSVGDKATSADSQATIAAAKATSADSQATIAAAKATSADSQATIAATKATSALGKATSADSQATLAANAAASALVAAALAAGYAASGATAAAVAAIGQPASVS